VRVAPKTLATLRRTRVRKFTAWWIEEARKVSERLQRFSRTHGATHTGWVA